MTIALAVYLAGMALVVTYVGTVYRTWAGKAAVDDYGQH